MFKQINLQENVSKDKYILMKSSKVEFCEIDKGYVKNIRYSWHDPNSMDIEVPYHITSDGVKKVNPLYNKFLGKGQYITVNDTEKYVVTECDRTEDYTGKKVKSIIAQSAEVTLNNFDFYIPSGGLVRKLYKVANDDDISEGILDLALADTRWTVKEVSDKARLEMNKIQTIYYKDIARPLAQVSGVTKGTTQLWAYGFTGANTLTVVADKELQVNISYKGIKSYIGGQLQKEETITHKLGGFAEAINRIEAFYSGNDQYRYAIRYDITLASGIKLERWHEFTYLDGMDVTVDEIKMAYTNGTVEEKSYMKIRSFDEGTYKVYDFLKNEVEQAYGIKIIYDTLNKQISCYTYEELGQDSSLFLSYENFIKNINKKSQYDQIVSKLYVESQEASISEENPTGQDYILDYSYFRENGLMSDELISAYDRYVASLGGKQDQIALKRIDLTDLNAKKIKLDTERRTLEEKIKGLQAVWTGYVKANSTADANRLATEINGLQTKHTQNLLDSGTVNQQIDDKKKEIEALVNTVTMENSSDAQGKIFTPELLDELSDITITDTLSDDYYTTPYSLYKYAESVLTKRNKLQIEFDIETVGLLQKMVVPNGMTFDNILTLGNYVHLSDTEIDNGRVRLIGFDYSPSEFKVSNFSFSNSDEDFSDLRKVSNVGRRVNKSSTYTSNYKTSWVQGKDVNNFVNSMLTDYMDTKAVNIRTRQGLNYFDMTEAGMYVVDGTNENNQIYIGGSMIAVTDDKWLTTKTCMDASGVYAQNIVGKLIAGQNLSIGNENNTMVIDQNGITIEGNILTIKGTDGQNKDFNSHFKVLSDQITSKVSKGQDFNQEFGTQFNQTVNAFDFTIGNDGTNIRMDKSGLRINQGALTVTNQNGQVIIDGSSNMFKIHKMEMLTLDAGQNLNFVHTLPHGLNQIPAYLAYQVQTTTTAIGTPSNTLLPALNISGIGAGGGQALEVSSVLRCNADNQNIYIQYLRKDTTIASQFRVNIFVLKEALI